VDRAAVHHHVTDIDTLREMVALDAFTLRLSPVTIPQGAGWREACLLLAVSMHDAMLAAGSLAAYLQLTLAQVTVLEPVEHTLRLMMEAGFDDETAARSLAALSSLAMAVAREQLLGPRHNGHPQVPKLREALEQEPARGFAILRRLADADLVSFDDAQLHTSIELILDGMTVRLARILAG
jgi:TetR/AcrR family transcriptional regulator, tetracycline repressor protein